MIYNELGKTGMKVSNLSFGASSLGGVFHDIREHEGVEAVHTAVDNGINFIDVSPYYGHTKAETVLGKALTEIPRDKYYLSTKVGRYGKDGVNTWDYSAQRVKASVYESMERLHIDFIDLINVHDNEIFHCLRHGSIHFPTVSNGFRISFSCGTGACCNGYDLKPGMVFQQRDKSLSYHTRST